MTDLAAGHLAADFAQGAVPALLVFLKPVLHLSYTMTAAVVLVATVTSSLAQPVFGHWSDRRGAVWLMPTGVLLAGAGVALAAVSPTYALLLVVIGISGLGVGAFHPEAMKVAGHASGARRASGMAFFASGGNIGFALGPLLASAAISPLGTTGGLLLVVPGVLVALHLLRERGYLTHIRSSRSAHAGGVPAADRPDAFKLLLVVIGLRSVAYYGLFTFVPLWEVSRGHSKSYGNTLLSLVLLAGVAGTLIAGPLADRYGRRVVLLASLALAPGLVLVYVLVGGTIGAVAVCGAGAVVVSTFGVTIGGIAAVVLGAIADAVDLRTALIATAFGPAVGVLVTLMLPGDRRLHATPATAAIDSQ